MWPFSKPPEPPASQPSVTIGAKYVLDLGTPGDPFPPKRSSAVALVRDVKSGWVRYSLGEIYNDERMKVFDFLSIYKQA